MKADQTIKVYNLLWQVLTSFAHKILKNERELANISVFS